MHKFWMVYGVGSGAPTVRHKSRESAVAEAKRLARVNHGVDFAVLEATHLYRKRDVDEVILVQAEPERAIVYSDDGIPF